MTHYICTGGCGGVSSKPGACRAENCPFHGKALNACECEDGTHTEAFDEATILPPEHENQQDEDE